MFSGTFVHVILGETYALQAISLKIKVVRHVVLGNYEKKFFIDIAPRRNFSEVLDKRISRMLDVSKVNDVVRSTIKKDSSPASNALENGSCLTP